MRAEDHYKGDYVTLTVIKLLKQMQDSNQHEAFGLAMYGVFLHFMELLPEGMDRHMYCIVLDAYFAYRGDLGKSLRDHEQKLMDTVGYEAHRDAMERLQRRIDETREELKEIFNVKVKRNDCH